MNTTKTERIKLMSIIIDEYLNTPENNRSLTKLGNKYGVKRQTISKWLKNNGYEVINYQNRCRMDETMFDNIDTEEKAYWLGFLYADGNISTVGNRLEINLSSKDLDHMLKFKKFLKLESEIKIDDNDPKSVKCRLSIRNKHMWNQLNDKGCVPCKSLVLKFPDKSIFKSQNLIYDFIRGYCDGDGSLGLYLHKGTQNHMCNLEFVGTENFLNGIQDFLGIRGTIRNKSCTNWANQAYELRYCGLKARQVARLLYENSSIYMDRKYNRYLQFCSFEEESSTAKSSKIERRCDANIEVNDSIAKGESSL